MMALIIGGSGSGKSAYAEDYLMRLCGEDFGGRKYYIATMQAFDEESRERIARHRRLRDGKGFVTIERPSAIERAAGDMALRGIARKAALLECISNLTANEMFAGAVPVPEETVEEKIVAGVSRLKAQLTHLVVVSNNVFEDGKVYDETTMAYIRAMGRINERLAGMADEVTEVVAGIPIKVKEGQKG